MAGLDVTGAPIEGPTADGFAWSPDGTRLVSDHALSLGVTGGAAQAVYTTIQTDDPAFQQAPQILVGVSAFMSCRPAWAPAVSP